ATVFVLLYFRELARVARKLGTGYVAALVLCFLLLLTSESRQEAPVSFLVLPVAVKAVDERGLRWPVFGFAALSALVTAKFWIDSRGLDPSTFAVEPKFLEFPLQYYF